MTVDIGGFLRGVPSYGKPIDRRLRRHPVFPGVRGPVVVVVKDGVGIGRADDPYNAVARAHTPVMDRLKAEALYTELQASGLHVGLLPDNTGNSEVGHNALGAGRWIEQGALLIDRKIKEDEFTKSPELNDMIEHCLHYNKPLHLMGLLQRHRSVHSHTDHLKLIVEYAASRGVKKIFVHGMVDGRDDPTGTAAETFRDVEAFLTATATKHGITCRLASGGGRMKITMDRYNAEPGMLELGWKTHVLGEGRQFTSGAEAIETLLAENEGGQEQNLPPFVIGEGGAPVGRIQAGDGVIFFNYRGDRAVEICQAFEDDQYSFFPRGPKLNVKFAGMMLYDGDRGIPRVALVTPPRIEGTMTDLLDLEGIQQLAIAETVKFGHVTYFWNGNNGNPRSTETWVNVPSDAPDMFQAVPAMKAAEVTARLIETLRTGCHKLARVNYANGDMVGHTGDFTAAKTAVEVVDRELGLLVEAVVNELGGAVISTADHGNSDAMTELDDKGKTKLDKKTGQPVPRLSHTSNPVPLYVALPSDLRGRVVLAEPFSGGERTIRSLSATTLNLLGFATPGHMDPSLVNFTV